MTLTLKQIDDRCEQDAKEIVEDCESQVRDVTNCYLKEKPGKSRAFLLPTRYRSSWCSTRSNGVQTRHQL
jgi:hypothetical protein